MSKVIIYKTEDSSTISIMYPIAPLEEAIKDLPKDAKGDTIAYEVVNKSSIPEDREFRDSWQLSGKKIVQDIAIAKEIKKDKLRKERAPLLASLDIEYQRALEENKGTNQIVEKKNKLRDITKEVDKVNTIEELKAIKVE
jgi:hypothetical protein